MPSSVTATALYVGLIAAALAAIPAASRPLVVAQAVVPPTGMMDAQHPVPLNGRYQKRFPQPARVGDLIGLPVLDLSSSTLGHVRQVVRTPLGKIELIVEYSRWWGWFGRPVAVPLEALGLEGRQLRSLDLSPREYAVAATWQDGGATPLPPGATVRVALGRN